MRVVSLLPAATEIVAALGAGSHLVGVTHECDYPPEVRALPRVTRSRLDPGLSSGEIDRALATAKREAAPTTEVDVELVARLSQFERWWGAACCAPPSTAGPRSGMARPSLRRGSLGPRADRDRGGRGCRRRSRRTGGDATVAGAQCTGARARGRRAVRLRRGAGAPRAGPGHGPGRAGAVRPARRVSRRQRLYFTPGAAAGRRGGTPRPVDPSLMASPRFVEARSEEHTSE